MTEDDIAERCDERDRLKDFMSRTAVAIIICATAIVLSFVARSTIVQQARWEACQYQEKACG